MQVIILRGISGAGKTWWIEDHVREQSRDISGDSNLLFPVCSADHYHLKVGGGRYDFRPENQGQAHLACLEKFFYVLWDKKDFHTMFVDNTNTTTTEMAPYIQLALLHGLPVRIVRVHASFETACRRNVHAVPPATIWRMHQNILTERLPSHWPSEEIILGE